MRHLQSQRMVVVISSVLDHSVNPSFPATAALLFFMFLLAQEEIIKLTHNLFIIYFVSIFCEPTKQ